MNAPSSMPSSETLLNQVRNSTSGSSSRTREMTSSQIPPSIPDIALYHPSQSQGAPSAEAGSFLRLVAITPSADECLPLGIRGQRYPVAGTAASIIERGPVSRILPAWVAVGPGVLGAPTCSRRGLGGVLLALRRSSSLADAGCSPYTHFGCESPRGAGET